MPASHAFTTPATLRRRDFTAMLAAQASGGDPLAGGRLFRHVRDYAAFGEHRTATPADHRTAAWLERVLRGAGCSADRRPFELQQCFVEATELKAGPAPVKAFPVWWPRVTGARPIRARLAVTSPIKGCIAVVPMPDAPGALIVPDSAIRKLVASLVSAGALAIVAVCQSPTGGILALNAEAGLEPWPIPFVMIGKKDEAALRDGEMASLLVKGAYNQRARAYEVIGRLNRGKRLIVVSTPYSGWFECAGERGPGIALWIGLAEWAAGRKSDASYLFVASSGHELNGIGLHTFLEKIAPKPAEVAAWLHLGAGIATYAARPRAGGIGIEMRKTASTLRRLYSTAEFAPALEKAFAAIPDLKPVVADRPPGELALIRAKGYPAFGFAGGSAFHHVPGDLANAITGPELIEPVGRALAGLLAELGG